MRLDKVNNTLKLALDCINSGQLPIAKKHLYAVLKLDPHNQNALHWLGILEGQTGNLAKSLELLETLISLKPTDPEIYYNLATTKMNLHQYHEATALFHKSLEINPKFVKSYTNLGHIAQEQNELSEAEYYLQQAIVLDNNNVLALYNLGTVKQRLDKYEDSVLYLEKALALAPSHLDALLALSRTYTLMDDIEKALQYLYRAMAIQPDNADTLFTLGEVLRSKELYEQASEVYKKAIQLNPNLCGAYTNLGVCLQALGKFSEAIEIYDKSLAIKSDPEIYCNRAQSLLHSGNLEQGFKDYEWRIHIPEHVPFFSYYQDKPRWQGELFSQKRLMVHYEQGFGDIFQLARYLPQVKERGGIVLFSVKKPLLRILETIPGIDYVVNADNVRSSMFDLSIPLMSLPVVFGTTLKTIPHAIPYIFPESEEIKRWKNKLKDSRGLKVGLVWAGNPKNIQGLKRTCKLSDISDALISLPNITYYSLQVREANKQISDYNVKLPIIDYTSDLSDFADTAALIANLDLIISVDTAVAHLAGAMGKTVWMLLPYANEWRWLKDRTDSPWYPSMVLFRQPVPRDWKTPLKQIALRLQSNL